MGWEGDKRDRYGLLDLYSADSAVNPGIFILSMSDHLHFFEFKCSQKRESRLTRNGTKSWHTHFTSWSSPTIENPYPLSGLHNVDGRDRGKLEHIPSRPLAGCLVWRRSNHQKWDSSPRNHQHKPNCDRIAVELHPGPDREGRSRNTESASDKATLLHRILAWSFGVLLLRSTVIIG